MRRIACCLALVMASVVISGCSSIIISTGKPFEYLQSHSTTMQRVEKRLGTPSWSTNYPAPLRIRDTPEFVSNSASQKYHRPFVWGVNDSAEKKIVKYCAVYTRRGPYWEDLRGQAYGMAAGMTLGISEICYLPLSIVERMELSQRYFSLTFWYDQDRRYVGSYEGDINNPKSDWFSGDEIKEAPGKSVDRTR